MDLLRIGFIYPFLNKMGIKELDMKQIKYLISVFLLIFLVSCVLDKDEKENTNANSINYEQSVSSSFEKTDEKDSTYKVKVSINKIKQEIASTYTNAKIFFTCELANNKENLYYIQVNLSLSYKDGETSNACFGFCEYNKTEEFLLDSIYKYDIKKLIESVYIKDIEIKYKKASLEILSVSQDSIKENTFSDIKIDYKLKNVGTTDLHKLDFYFKVTSIDDSVYQNKVEKIDLLVDDFLTDYLTISTEGKKYKNVEILKINYFY